MPLYEYRCSTCGKVFEVIQKFSDAALTVHEGCGGAVERLLSAPAFQFKGSGWYVTDYAKSSSPEASPKSDKKDAGGKEAGSKSGEAKSDGKASSSETKADSSPAATTSTKGS